MHLQIAKMILEGELFLPLRRVLGKLLSVIRKLLNTFMLFTLKVKTVLNNFYAWLMPYLSFSGQQLHL